MTAKLMTRKVGWTEFLDHGTFEASEAVFEDTGNLTEDGKTVSQLHDPARTDAENAHRMGEQLCAEGEIDAFEVWQLVTRKQRVWKLEDVAS